MRKTKQPCCYLIITVFLSMLLANTIASYADNIRIGQYLSVPVKPYKYQKNLLQQHIQIKFPQNTLTIQQAIVFALQFSGYHLATSKEMNHSAQEMLGQKLPEIDRNLGPVTLQQALITLAGQTFHLLIDPVHRLVAFKIKARYQILTKKGT